MKKRHPILNDAIKLGAILVLFLLVKPILGMADEKVWTGHGDSSSWEDDTNWNPEGAPSETDEVIIQKKDSNVKINERFSAKNITVGGKDVSDLNIDSFVSGTISPDTNTNHSVMNRRDGTIHLKGPGVIKVKGSYLDSEESMAPEPSFMVTIS